MRIDLRTVLWLELHDERTVMNDHERGYNCKAMCVTWNPANTLASYPAIGRPTTFLNIHLQNIKSQIIGYSDQREKDTK